MIELYGTYKNISASANCMDKPGMLSGIFVASASATPTITVYDSSATSTSTLVVNTFTPIGGTWYPMPFAVKQGVYVVIAGTVDCTVGTLKS